MKSASLEPIDNQYYSSHPISIAIGHATTKENEQVEDMLKRADHHMYQEKSYYQKFFYDKKTGILPVFI